MLAVRSHILRMVLGAGKRRNASFLYRTFSDECGNSTGDKGTGSSEPGSSCSPSDTNPSLPSMYECRKYGHSLPANDTMPCFDPLPNVPTGVFRCTAGEVLGPGACKINSYYRCPEYFSYNHMTYYDMHLILRHCRQPSPKTGRKP